MRCDVMQELIALAQTHLKLVLDTVAVLDCEHAITAHTSHAVRNQLANNSVTVG